MLDLGRLQRIKLTAAPRGQKFVAWVLLAPNFHLPPRVRVEVEGYERLPAEPVLFAMNHTDRYNYWPFQYHLYRNRGRFTATWVKGKYYESEALGWFMERTCNIPTVSRGYVITRDFLGTLGRRPQDEEYRLLRERVDAVAHGGDPGPAPEAADLATILTRPRSILGQAFDPGRESWAQCVDGLFRRMMARFVELNEEALDVGLDLLVFPEGTRSRRLSRGHIGLAQIALKYRKTIVPVGCNGSDRCYPGSSPWAKGGRIVYRIGEPIPYEELAPFHIDEDYQPFTPEAETRHRGRFQGAVDVVMKRIEGLLDERHHPAADEVCGVRGSHRFV